MGNGLALAVSGLVLALTTGAAPATPSTTPPMTCPPALPVSGAPSAVTTTTVTISYSLFLTPPCGYDPPVTVTFFASHDDAQQWVNPVAEAVSGPARSGSMTVGGLTPDTTYWFRFSADGRRDPYVFGSVRTTPVPVCAATARVDSAWNGGFVATVTVRNVGDQTLDGWHVSWRWAGDERIEALWNAERQGDAAVANASYNATLGPAAETTFGMLVTSSAPPGNLTLGCGR